jgi:uncharacterized integral membrane protein (TIGR00697 family)
MSSVNFTDKSVFSYLVLTSIFVGAYSIAPLLAMKIVNIGPITLPAGDFIYALTFLCTDITNEVFGKKYARNIVKCGLLTLIIVYLGTQLAMVLPAADFWEQEETFNEFFGTGFRIFLATIFAYIFSQFADVYIFNWVRQKTGEKKLWLRNNISTFVARFLDVVTFVMIAFYGVYENSELLSIIAGGYVAGLIVSVVDTPFVYLGVKFIQKKHPELKQ